MIPIELKPHCNILIAGCGGGFDVIAAGFPVGLALEKQGHHVVYSSYSFTRLTEVRHAESIHTMCPYRRLQSKCSSLFSRKISG